MKVLRSIFLIEVVWTKYHRPLAPHKFNLGTFLWGIATHIFEQYTKPN